MSFILTSYLKRKVVLFKKIGTPVNAFRCFVLFLVLHKIISDLLNAREITFLFLSVMSFGIFLSLTISKKKDSLGREKSEKEIIKIQEISAQSQLNNYNKTRPKNDN